MWRWALVFVVLSGSAEAGQVRSSFQVGLTITGPVSASTVSSRRIASALIPLPKPRPAAAPVLANSQGKPSLSSNGE